MQTASQARVCGTALQGNEFNVNMICVHGNLSLTLHKVFSTGVADMLESRAFADPMLDACCWMLDNLQPISSDIYKHPASRSQYPGSANDSKAYRRNRIGLLSYLMQLRGYFIRSLKRVCIRGAWPPVGERENERRILGACTGCG